MANSASIHFYVGDKTGVERKKNFSKENPKDIHCVFLEPHEKIERLILGCLLWTETS